MALTVVVTDDAALVMERMAKAGISHPVSQSKVFVKPPLTVQFSMGANGTTPTVTIDQDETHKWAYSAEPAVVFDDRVLR